jgi:16S rRNA (guanine527-N7)-methyltransferase
VNFSRSRLADVGSGAGFPGLPLAMMIPGVDVTLIESNTKKCAFLSEVTRELDFSNVTVFRGRMEDLPINSDPFGFVTARALGHHDDLLKWASGRLSSGGKAILWLGDQDATNLSRRTDWNWGERALIPGSERRYILSGSLKR